MTAPTPLLIRDAERGGDRVDVLVGADGVIAAVGRGLRPSGDVDVLDAGGGALLPGLHDHHLHLLALAARAASISAAPPAVRGPSDFDRLVRAADRTAAPATWLRIVDYDDEIGGALDRSRLDTVAPVRPVRVLHRSGAYWALNGAALDAIGLGGAADQRGAWPAGVELDEVGRPTGRLWRLDDWLRRRLPAAAGPDLRTVGGALAVMGVTGVTDATATDDLSYFTKLAGAVRSGDLPVEVTVTGGLALAGAVPPSPLRSGPVKLIVGDHDLPDPAALAGDIAAAHEAGRPVAIHCVTRAAAALCLAAWSAGGTVAGDRLEHGSVLGPEMLPLLASAGITVVSQPAFVRDRGDDYLGHVDSADVPDLYRLRSLLDAGIPVGGSTDAPHGSPDPWRAMSAACQRHTATGVRLGIDEALTAARAVALFTSPAGEPGGAPRAIETGSVADLCVLDRPLNSALSDLASVTVALTVRAGTVTYRLS